MSDKKITDLPLASSINVNDVSVLVNNGTDYKFAFSTLLQLIGSSLNVGVNILFGTTLPQNSTGNNGDVFINTTTGSFAQKISGAWTIVYTMPSATGTTDGTILYGVGVPGNATGNNNDTYIDTGTGVFYKKTSGTWSQVFSMQTGPSGPTGANGANGTNGTNGFSILNGVGNPSNISTGVNGDFYINTTNYTLFGPKTAGSWGTGISLIGSGVPFGGTSGEVLAKTTNSDFDTDWVDLDLIYLKSSGGTLTGDVQQTANPINANSLITKGYADNLITGLSWKQEVKAATTGSITLSGTQTIDGVSLIANDRVLVKNQTAQVDNGIYLVKAGAWTRTTDADTGAEIGSAAVLVRKGTVNGNTQWTCTNNSDPVIGTDTITFAQISGAGTYTNGTGLALISNVFSLDSSYTDARYLKLAGGALSGNLNIGTGDFTGLDGQLQISGPGGQYISLKSNSVGNDIANHYADGTNHIYAGLLGASAGTNKYGIYISGGVRFSLDGLGNGVFNGGVSAGAFTDGYISIGSAQINRTSGFVELQYPGAGGVRMFGATGTPIVFDTGGSITTSGNVSVGSQPIVSTSTPTNITFDRSFSNGTTDSSLKLYLFNGGSTGNRYGFGVGTNSDVQYHTGINGSHDFYVNNSKIASINNTGLSVIGDIASYGNYYLQSSHTFQFDYGISNAYSIGKNGTNLEFKSGSTFLFNNLILNTSTESLRSVQDNTYLSFYNSASTTRTGYLQFTAGGAITLAAENAASINLNGANVHLNQNLIIGGTTPIPNWWDDTTGYARINVVSTDVNGAIRAYSPNGSGAASTIFVQTDDPTQNTIVSYTNVGQGMYSWSTGGTAIEGGSDTNTAIKGISSTGYAGYFQSNGIAVYSQVSNTSNAKLFVGHNQVSGDVFSVGKDGKITGSSIALNGSSDSFLKGDGSLESTINITVTGNYQTAVTGISTISGGSNAGFGVFGGSYSDFGQAVIGTNYAGGSAGVFNSASGYALTSSTTSPVKSAFRATQLGTGPIIEGSNGNTISFKVNPPGDVISLGSFTGVSYKVATLNTAPSTSSDTGTLGEIRYTSGYIYVCIATNTWVRAALSTF